MHLMESIDETQLRFLLARLKVKQLQDLEKFSLRFQVTDGKIND